MKSHCFFLTFVTLACVTLTQGQVLSFTHLTTEQGLSQNAVVSITQDKSGFMWLGTARGLNRYDGTRFRVYKYDGNDSTSISGDYINSLFNDSQQTLWIGTSGGLNIYDSRKDVFERIHNTGDTYIHCIYEDRKGRIWIGSHHGLYLLRDRRKRQFQSFYASNTGIAGNTVRAVFEDHEGNIWIGTNNGLTRMQWKNGQYQFETFRHDRRKAGTLSADYITSIAEDKQHKLWVGTLDAGLNLYDRVTNTFTTYSQQDNDASSLINNHIIQVTALKNKIWVGTDEGLSIIDPVSQKITSYQNDPADKKTLSHNSVYSLFEDKNGSMWIGTYFGGVNISTNSPFHILQNDKGSAGLSNNVVTGMVEDREKNLWIGTDGGGLNYLDKKTGRFTVYKNKLDDPSSLGSNRVKAVYIDKENNTWVATHGGGLCVLDRKTNKFKRYLYGEVDNAVTIRQFTSIAEDEEGRLWVAGNCPLRVFRKKGIELQALELNKEIPSFSGDIYATVLFKDAGHHIWVGGQFAGLYKLSGNTITFVKTPAGHTVNCIGEDLNGNIWVGLNYGGLAGYNRKTGSLTRYGENDDISDRNIIGLLTDDKGNIWMSTDNGLLTYYPAQNRFQVYNVSDGLAGSEFNYNSYFKGSNGELFFGGFNGITSFFPGHIEINKNTVPVVFTGLKLLNKNIVIGDENQLLKEDIGFTDKLVFKYDQNVFTIEFALLNFIHSTKNRYAYKLAGVQDEWTETNTPSATFTNLPAGNYILQVKAANNDGIWSAPAVMKITVLSPFWKTGWAYLFYFLLATNIVFFIVRFFYLQGLLQRDKQLHEVKLNFFTNISHEIRTHLTLIMAPIEKMQQQIAHNNVLQHHLNNTRKNANRLLKLVTELMDFRKTESGRQQLHIGPYNLVDFLNDIYNSFEYTSQVKNIRFSFVHNMSDIPLYFDREQMEKVVYNLLTNAFKFTPDGGRICLHAEDKKKTVQIHVTDNGRGVAPEYINQLFTSYFQANDTNGQNTGYGIGLALARNIVELHKGTLTVTSNAATAVQDRTTCFTVTLLKGFEHLNEAAWVPAASDHQPELMNKVQEPIFIPLPAVTGNTEEKQYHILIAEDNEEVRHLLKDTLYSYKLTQCINGVDGLQSAFEQIPDLIISDVMMPEMDGLELCYKLKTDERTSHIPVILLTAKVSQGDQVTGLHTGADIYLTKPFSTQVLELTVKNLLAAREKMRQKFSKEFVLAPRNIIVNTIDEQFLDKLVSVIEEHMGHHEFGVELLAKKMAMSQSVLYKKVKAVTNMSVNDFAKTIRLKKAAQLLEQKFTVFDVSVMTGFSDRKYFSKEFKKQFGKTPSEFHISLP